MAETFLIFQKMTMTLLGPGKRGHIVTDTLLLMMFLGLRKLGNICCGHKMFLNKIRNIFCVPDTKFVSATNVARGGKRGNICVGNNVSATLCPRLPGPFLRPSSDAVHMSRIECNWGKSFVLLMWSKASELGLISFQFIFSFESNLHRFVHPKHLSRVE